jgi:hypothetical protein
MASYEGRNMSWLWRAHNKANLRIVANEGFCLVIRFVESACVNSTKISRGRCSRYMPSKRSAQINTIKHYHLIRNSISCVYIAHVLSRHVSVSMNSIYSTLNCKLYKLYRSLELVLKHMRSIKSTPYKLKLVLKHIRSIKSTPYKLKLVLKHIRSIKSTP